MSIIVYKGERKLSDLVIRAYGGGLKAADARLAENALLAANPQLAKLRELKEGTLLAVPQVPGVATAPSDAPDATMVVLASGRENLELYRRRLAIRLDEERKAFDATGERLKSKEAKALTKLAPDSAPYFERAAAAMKSQKKDLDDRAAIVKALARLRADFDELLEKLG